MWSPSPTVEAPTEEGCISVADTVLFPVGTPISSLTPSALPGTLSVAGPGSQSAEAVPWAATIQMENVLMIPF